MLAIKSLGNFIGNKSTNNNHLLFNMKQIQYPLMFIILPLIASAGESSRGTVIMISSVSGWLLLVSAFFMWRHIKQSRAKKNSK